MTTAPTNPPYDAKCNDLLKRMSASAQTYARTGDTKRYNATHADINAVLAMKKNPPA